MRPPRGGGSSGGFRGGRGGSSRGGKGKGGKGRDMGPPDRVVEIGVFLHNAETDMVCKSTSDKIPYFNAPIYLENKQKVGKVEDVLGPINEVFFTIKPDDGVESSGFEKEKKFYIDPMKLLDAQRFIDAEKPKPKGAGGKGGKGGGKGGEGVKVGPEVARVAKEAVAGLEGAKAGEVAPEGVAEGGTRLSLFFYLVVNSSL
eukprot:CAMPEP_0175139230 /NCGR_PEP_ID=MMETSP0087-20121206/10784_1 /TAXON_ID=136419 /ORGANISM="Unknown Unknown, Strain D1" /LENGTH=200 /DNA_ID=CAMNT_0016422211 /DNA_START=29 /DNA_END=632 /DNA_ORIENTATION=+